MSERLDSLPDRMNELKMGLRIDRILMGARLRMVGSYIADILEPYGRPDIVTSSPFMASAPPQELWEQSSGDDMADTTLVEG